MNNKCTITCTYQMQRSTCWLIPFDGLPPKQRQCHLLQLIILFVASFWRSFVDLYNFIKYAIRLNIVGWAHLWPGLWMAWARKRCAAHCIGCISCGARLSKVHVNWSLTVSLLIWAAYFSFFFVKFIYLVLFSSFYLLHNFWILNAATRRNLINWCSRCSRACTFSSAMQTPLNF